MKYKSHRLGWTVRGEEMPGGSSKAAGSAGNRQGVGVISGKGMRKSIDYVKDQVCNEGGRDHFFGTCRWTPRLGKGRRAQAES